MVSDILFNQLKKKPIHPFRPLSWLRGLSDVPAYYYYHNPINKKTSNLIIKMDESRMNASLSTLRGHYYWLFPSVIISLSLRFVRSHYWVKKRESFAPTVYSKRENLFFCRSILRNGCTTSLLLFYVVSNARKGHRLATFFSKSNIGWELS